MTARRFLYLLCLAALALLCQACASVEPDSITFDYKRERDLPHQRWSQDEYGISATYDLPKPRAHS